MLNHKKQDNISVNVISPTNDIKNVSEKPVGNADKDPFCVYAHKRHAVGSKLVNEDGSNKECKDDTSWQNSK
jgi:hypothetical protein